MPRRNINIDDNAYSQLAWAKEQIRKDGVDAPNHSDAIRYLKDRGDKK